MRGLVFAHDPRRPWLAARSLRSLRWTGASSIELLPAGAALPSGMEEILLLKAGAWFRDPTTWQPPPISATLRPLLALGHVHSGQAGAAWKIFRQENGGEFKGHAAVPPILSAWIDSPALQLLKGKYLSIEELWTTLFRDPMLRIVPWAPLDVEDDSGIRALQVVTSLQQGGAERVTWDLHDLLPGLGVASGVITLGRPLRRSLPAPARNWMDLSGMSREGRELWVKHLVAQFGADLIHGHLIDREDIRRFSRAGLPLTLTVHNMNPGWPAGLTELSSKEVPLLVACSQAVERDLELAKMACPTRTVWNGVDGPSISRNASPPDSHVFTLVCIANPRHQKRLHLLPSILVAVEKQLDQHEVKKSCRLLIAGEVSDQSPEAIACYDQTQAESTRCQVTDRLQWLDGENAVAEALTAADVLVSPSLYEGLSLAHMEALAAGVPVVATDSGGTPELGWRNPSVILVPVDATPESFAQAIVKVSGITDPAERMTQLSRDFSRHEMARRYAWLYEGLLGPEPGETLWLVTNNLSTGGAQSSLRRLAKAWAAQGRDVRVAILQEHPHFPTPGREDLLRTGIPVIALPPTGSVSELQSMTELLAEMRAAPPRAVLLWNVIPACKVLLADILWRIPIFDVSPGEMYFSSLERYFANPLPALPYRSAAEYGARLAGVIVKYTAEAARASQYLGAPVHIIPNGIPLPQLRVEKTKSSGQLVLGTAARINPQKRLEDLLDAFQLALDRLPNCRLKIAGGVEDGCDDYALSLREKTQHLPVDWLGELGDLVAFHASLDIFVMISEPAGCPNASLEAMAAALPVIATDVGGASEQIEDGVTGRLVPPRNSQALANAIVDLANDPSLSRTMALAARHRAENSFSIPRMAEAYLKLIPY